MKGRISSSQEDGKHKPLPDVYLRACALAGMPPDRGVAVEDTPFGVESACAAGLTVVGYAADSEADQLVRAGTQEVLTRMSDLPRLLRLFLPRRSLRDEAAKAQLAAEADAGTPVGPRHGLF